MKGDSTTTTRRYAVGYGHVAEGSALGRPDSDSLIHLPVDEAARADRAHFDPPGWRHTLILTGNLDHRSASELEDEIECLRQEGVTALTLDLHRLDEIDPAGAQVIAEQGALFQEGGRSLAVIPEGLLSRDLLAEAPVRNVLMNASREGFVPRFGSPRRRGEGRSHSTTMIKHLTSNSVEGA